MPDSQIEEVKSKIDIVQIIGSHIQLNKSGSNFKGLCPFHSEKSSSFMVSQELQIYKCFGCGEGGDVFTFLQKYEGMEFSEALHFLAEKTGVVLNQSASFEVSDKNILYEINAMAAKFYNYLLVNHQVGKIALNYLKEERKINLEAIQTFNIGFAPAQKNVLSDFLVKKKKFKIKDLDRAGLVFITKTGKVYDRFEGRIIFPISDHRGNVIALAGRQIPPGNPKTGKYINSPETEIYHKSRSLYGLNITKDFVKKDGFAVVVEGEIDLISSYKVGIKNVVAIKGSAFTVDQARLLSRYTKEIVLALDTDFAGVEASLRGVKILQDLEFEIRVAKLGRFKDPDEASADPQFYKNAINNSVNFWDFIIEATSARFDINTVSGKTKIGKVLAPILAQIDNKIVQDFYIKKLAKLLEVNTDSVLEEVEKIGTNAPQGVREVQTKVIKPINELREERLLGLILTKNIDLLKNKDLLNLIQTPILKRIAEESLNFESIKSVQNSLSKELLDKFNEIILEVGNLEEKEKKYEINEIYKQLSISFLRSSLGKSIKSSQYSELQKKIKDFESGSFERIIT